MTVSSSGGRVGKFWSVGIVLGIIWLVMGLSNGNTGIWMLGLIMLGLGGYLWKRDQDQRKEEDQSTD
jgi:hypothetical protein